MKNKAKIAIVVILIIALIAACVFLVTGLTRFVRGADINASEPDPMFETPREIVTRPPELDREEEQPEHATLDDYVDENQTMIQPVTEPETN